MICGSGSVVEYRKIAKRKSPHNGRPPPTAKKKRRPRLPKAIEQPPELQRKRAAAEELATAPLLLADPLIVLDDQLAARQHVRRAGWDLAALERRVVDPHVERVLAEQLLALRIPDHDVGVGADRDRALLAVHPEDLGRRRRGDLDEAVERELAAEQAL